MPDTPGTETAPSARPDPEVSQVTEDGTSVVQEWRVTGQPPGPYPAYDFTWRSDRAEWPGDEAEHAARTFLTNITSDDAIGTYGPWQNPQLWHRTVTYSPWAEQS